MESLGNENGDVSVREELSGETREFARRAVVAMEKAERAKK